MRPLTDQASAAARTTRIAVQALDAAVSSNPFDLPTLGKLEISLNEMLLEYRRIFSEIAPKGSWGPAVNKQVYEPFFRCFVAATTLFKISAPLIVTRLGRAWGEHLFGTNDFYLVRFDDIEHSIPPAGLRIVLPDLAEDLVDAFSELGAYMPAFAHHSKLDLVQALEKICDEAGCNRRAVSKLASGYGMKLLSPAAFAAELGLTDAEVQKRARARRVIGVPLWSGEWAFPDFQLDPAGGSLTPNVVHVLRNAHDDFRGWPLALWMSKNVRPPNISYYEAVLGSRGLWKPHWTQPGTGQFGHVGVNQSASMVTGPVYRVSKREYAPFYFASSDPAKGSADPPTGRFDQDASSGRGSMYTAETGVGACHEVLDRAPVLTLREVLSRTLWTVSPTEPVEVADLSGYGTNLAGTTNRMDTQDVANRLAGRWKGLRVGLRTRNSEMGVVFFGPSGPTLPAAAGLGVWEAHRSPLFASDDLWAYVEARHLNHGDHPTIFRRFPDEISVP